jgi:ABC-2 type transport system ATP-binding protein
MYALTIDQLTKTYANGFQALKGISLKVEQGDFFALLGPNGAGKSTTIGIISTLVNKSGGKICVFEHDLDRKPRQAKQLLGLVPQEINFNQFERVEDILLTQAGFYGHTRTKAKARAEKSLKQLGLWDKRKERSRDLSGGMKRRLMIARALMHQPKLLILDEPTAGVDIELRHNMWQFLQQLNATGTTIILTTHYLEEAEHLCRNIAIIDEGVIVRHSDMRSLLSEVNSETFVIDVRNKMTQAPSDLNFNLRLLNEHTLEAEVREGQSLNHLFEILTQHGLEVRSLKNKSNRLEQLFLNLVRDDVA